MTNNELLLATSNMLDPIMEEVQGIKQDVSILKKVVTEHSEKLQKIS